MLDSRFYERCDLVAAPNYNSYLELLNPYIKSTPEDTVLSCGNALTVLAISINDVDLGILKLRNEIEELGKALIIYKMPTLDVFERFSSRIRNIIRGFQEAEYPPYEIALLEVILYAIEYEMNNLLLKQ